MKGTTRRLWVCLPVIFSMLAGMALAEPAPATATRGEGWHLAQGVLTIETDAGQEALAHLLSDTEAAWPHCTQVETIELGPEVWAPISPVFAQRLPNLATYRAHADHEFYTALDGVLLGGGDGSQLWAYPPAKADTSYTIPDSVVMVAPDSFSHNTQLEAVYISPQVTAIADRAFDGSCTRLTNLEVSSQNSVFSSQDGVLFVQNNTELWRYMPARSDTSYTIPQGVEYILDKAFAGAPPIEQLYVPQSLSQFEENFRGFSALQGVHVDPDNPYFASDSVGALFGREDKVLLAFPLAAPATDYAVPEGVETIAPYAFSGSNLAGLTLPSSLTHIGQGAFARCGSLSFVGLPLGLKQLGSGAFADDSALSTLWFQGPVPPAVAPDAFTGCNSLSAMYVPRGQATAYLTALAAYTALLQERTYIAADGWTLDNERISIKSQEGLTAFYRVLATAQWPYAKEVTTLQLADGVVLDEFGPLAALSLEAYQVSPTHPAYTVEEGVLLDKSGRTLLAYPPAKSGADYVLPPQVTDLHPQAFSAVQQLKTLTLCASFEPTYPTGFALGSTVQALAVSPDNPNFTAQDGVLFSKDGTRLLRYPPARLGQQYTVPNGVTHLAPNSFLGGAAHLQDLTLPDSLAQLAVGSLEAITGLELLTFSGSKPPSLPANFVLPTLRAITIPTGSLAQYQQTFAAWSALFLEGGGIPNPPPEKPEETPGGTPGGGGLGGGSTSPQQPQIQPGHLTVAATTQGNSAMATVPTDGLQAAIASAQTEFITLTLLAPAEVRTITLTLPHGAMAKIPPLALHMVTPLGTLKLDSKALSALVQAGSHDIVLQLARVDGTTLISEATSRPTYTLSGKNGTAAITHLDGGTLRLTLPYVHAATEDPNAIVVQQVTTDGKRMPQLSLYRPDKGTVTARLRQFGTYAIGHAPVNFSDVPQSAWFAPAVTTMAAKGLFLGTDDGFSPHEPMTRGMFAAVLARLDGADLSVNTATNFSDVADGAWYADAVRWAASRNLIGGYGTGQFGPNDPLTREQMAAMLHKYMAYSDGPALPQTDCPPFADQETISPWAAQGVESLQNQGLLQGNGGYYNPQATATRAEISKLLHNYIELLLNE